MGFRVRYSSSAELVSDWDAQLSRGGLLVRADAPEGTAQFAPVRVALACPAGRVTLDAQVMQIFPGTGTAVTFTSSAGLAELVERARAEKPMEGPAPSEHRWLENDDDDDDEREEEIGKRATGGPPSVKNASAEKIAMALRGTRDDRATVLREGNPALQGYVLRNPGLQLDEIAAIARMRTVTAELLKQIAERREWASRPEIAIGLVRNPKTPVGIAVRLLDHVSATDLRQLAKDQHTRTPIQQAARKKVIGGG